VINFKYTRRPITAATSKSLNAWKILTGLNNKLFVPKKPCGWYWLTLRTVDIFCRIVSLLIKV
jgi:hypothetical protein